MKMLLNVLTAFWHAIAVKTDYRFPLTSNPEPRRKTSRGINPGTRDIACDVIRDGHEVGRDRKCKEATRGDR